MSSHYRTFNKKTSAPPLRVGIVGTVGVPACYGGFETLAEQLIISKRRKSGSRNIDYSVFCSSASYPVKYSDFHGASLHYIPLKANGMQSIIYDSISLIKACRQCDVILMLGVSGCSFLPLFRIFCKKRLIINIDGLEHRRQKWKPFIKKFLKYSEKCAIKYADVIIADNEGIIEYVNSKYDVDAKLIPYGGDQALMSVPIEIQQDILDYYDIRKKDYAFGLCRIEPENNVEMILEAFSKVPEKTLLFVGNWENSPYGKNLKEKYSQFPNILLHDAIYDLKVVNTLRLNCSLYLHGHSAGGTNPSLVEAMFFGIPIVAFDVNYNRFTTNDKAVYFDTSDKLQEILTDSRIDELRQCGIEMKKLAREKYLWKNIASEYEALYYSEKNDVK